MPKHKTRTYNRYGQGGDLLDVAWRAQRAGKMEWSDVQSIQDSLMPDCYRCGAKHAGRMLIEKRGFCQECFKVEIRNVFEARKAAQL